ncbi:MAG: SCP2 sterol-binding domain-containing protein [Firmicutes bacterium]|jgi:putative sterol carrier protein|nr:SCP2 sterol-binding domain-containing protein [Bacillota bacterium]
MSDLFSPEWLENFKSNLSNALKLSLPETSSDESIEIAQVVTGSGDKDVSYVIRINNNNADVVLADPDDTTPTLITDYSTYTDLLQGTTDVSDAIFAGKIKFKGDMQLLVANKQLLKAIGSALASQA